MNQIYEYQGQKYQLKDGLSVEEAKGKILNFIDSQDINVPEHKEIKQEDFEIFGTKRSVLEQEGTKVKNIIDVVVEDIKHLYGDVGVPEKAKVSGSDQEEQFFGFSTEALPTTDVPFLTDLTGRQVVDVKTLWQESDGVKDFTSKIGKNIAKIVVGDVYAVGDVGFKTLFAPIQGTISAVGQTTEELAKEYLGEDGFNILQSKLFGSETMDVADIKEGIEAFTHIALINSMSKAPKISQKQYFKQLATEVKPKIRVKAESQPVIENVKETISETIADQASKTSNKTKEEIKIEIKEKLDKADKEGEKKAEEITKEADDLYIKEDILAEKPTKEILDAGVEILTEAKIRRNPKIPLQTQIVEAIVNNQISRSKAESIAIKYGTSLDNILVKFVEQGTLAGKELNWRSQASKALEKIYTKDELAKMGRDTSHLDTLSLWDSLEGWRKGLLVSMPKTAIRNLLTVLERATLKEPLADLMDIVLQSPLRLAHLVSKGKLLPDLKTTPLDAVGLLVKNVFRGPWEGLTKLSWEGLKKNKKLVDEILADQPSLKTKLFDRWMSDVEMGPIMEATIKEHPIKGRIIKAGNNIVKYLNILNRSQEYMMRRASFIARLDRLTRENLKENVWDIIGRKEYNKIKPEWIKESIDFAHEVTFAKDFGKKKVTTKVPTGFEKKFGNFAQGFIDTINGLKVGPLRASLMITFPRFIMNAFKYMFDWSPLGFAKWMGEVALSKTARDRVAKGDTRQLSQAIVGTGYLLAAWQMVNSDHQGKKWYEIYVKPGSRIARMLEPIGVKAGSNINILGFHPIVAPIFFANLYKRHLEGTLDKFSLKELINGISAQSIRGGMSILAIDKMLNDLYSERKSSPDKIWDKFISIVDAPVGTYFAGYLTPFKTVKDFIIDFQRWTTGESEEAAFKETRLQPIEGAISYRVPTAIAGGDLPERQYPTRVEGKEQQLALISQLTGLTATAPRNWMEDQLVELGIEKYVYFPKTGDDVIDIEMEKISGPISNVITDVLRNQVKFDQIADRELKQIIMKSVWTKIRKAALDGVLKKAIDTKDKGLEARIKKMKLKKLPFAKQWELKQAEAEIAKRTGSENFSFDDFFEQIIEENK